MKGQHLFEITIRGKISTNSNREIIREWRERMERSFASLFFHYNDESKISITIKFWISSHRLQMRHNDLDNLVKPILDGMIKTEIIRDDADIYHIETTKHSTNGEEEVQIIVREWN